MSVYIINNMVIHHRTKYMEYVRAFMPVFLKYQGEVVAVRDDPKALEGSWPYSRTVVLRLPSKQIAEQWYRSAEYQAIARHRWNSTDSNATMIPAFEVPTSTSGAASGHNER